MNEHYPTLNSKAFEIEPWFDDPAELGFALYRELFSLNIFEPRDVRSYWVNDVENRSGARAQEFQNFAGMLALDHQRGRGIDEAAQRRHHADPQPQGINRNFVDRQPHHRQH